MRTLPALKTLALRGQTGAFRNAGAFNGYRNVEVVTSLAGATGAGRPARARSQWNAAGVLEDTTDPDFVTRCKTFDQELEQFSNDVNAELVKRRDDPAVGSFGAIQGQTLDLQIRWKTWLTADHSTLGVGPFGPAIIPATAEELGADEKTFEAQYGDIRARFIRLGGTTVSGPPPADSSGQTTLPSAASMPVLAQVLLAVGAVGVLVGGFYVLVNRRKRR